jgi:TPP-dependent pyruvate/acetoin dehydrogenase alpha subunit
VEEWKKRDPIVLLTRELREHGQLTEGDEAALESEVSQEIERAVEFAEAGTWERVEELTRFVYSERKA